MGGTCVIVWRSAHITPLRHRRRQLEPSNSRPTWTVQDQSITSPLISPPQIEPIVSASVPMMLIVPYTNYLFITGSSSIWICRATKRVSRTSTYATNRHATKCALSRGESSSVRLSIVLLVLLLRINGEHCVNKNNRSPNNPPHSPRSSSFRYRCPLHVHQAGPQHNPPSATALSPGCS